MAGLLPVAAPCCQRPLPLRTGIAEEAASTCSIIKPCPSPTASRRYPKNMRSRSGVASLRLKLQFFRTADAVLIIGSRTCLAQGRRVSPRSAVSRDFTKSQDLDQISTPAECFNLAGKGSISRPASRTWFPRSCRLPAGLPTGMPDALLSACTGTVPGSIW